MVRQAPRCQSVCIRMPRADGSAAVTWHECKARLTRVFDADHGRGSVLCRVHPQRHIDSPRRLTPSGAQAHASVILCRRESSVSWSYMVTQNRSVGGFSTRSTSLSRIGISRGASPQAAFPPSRNPRHQAFSRQRAVVQPNCRTRRRIEALPKDRDSAGSPPATH